MVLWLSQWGEDWGQGCVHGKECALSESSSSRFQAFTCLLYVTFLIQKQVYFNEMLPPVAGGAAIFADSVVTCHTLPSPGHTTLYQVSVP